MDWFDGQVRMRKQQDEEYLENAIKRLVGSVSGKRLSDAFDNDALNSSTLEAILRCFGIKAKIPPMPKSFLPSMENEENQDDQLEYRLRPFGITWRRVELEDNWYNLATGPLLGWLKDGRLVALLPNKIRGYSIYNAQTGKSIKVNRRTDKLLERKAMCFYKPFPLRKLSVKDLWVFVLSLLSTADIVRYVLALAIVTAAGTISPIISKLLFSDVLESGSMQVLCAMAMFSIGFCLSQAMLSAYKALVQSRTETKVSLAVQAAVMNRVLQLPPSFFKNFAAGDLSQRTGYLQTLCTSFFSSVGNIGLSSIFSLVYIGQIFTFAPSMALPALGISLASVCVSIVTTLVQIGVTREIMAFNLRESAISYSTITGIQKIKLTGSEKRMFARWLNAYAESASLQYNSPLFLRFSGMISLAVSLAGVAIMYFVAMQSNVSIGDYFAFNSAYGMVSGAIMSLSGIVSTVATIRPTLEMAKPLLDAVPEISEDRKLVTKLKGTIEVHNVSFRYDDQSPWVLDEVSLKINRGEYVAIVGKTGCGKSTLLRLLLGFETPQKGSIYYDGMSMDSLDLKSLRRRIGAVLQDGKLFNGDIYSNIVLSAPSLSVQDAWEAAELAAIADDIRAMPMGMHTVISEGQGGISGGQRQRLMIACAIAPKPSVLLFDEATSALDNLTQKHVSQSLDSMKCTRVVIAHRLSTIQNCDRIIMLDEGHVVEEGTYQELIDMNGKFAELVERQRIGI